MCVTYYFNPLATTKMKVSVNLPYIPVITISRVPSCSRFDIYLKFWMARVATKYKFMRNGSIGFITVVAPTLNTKPQSPFSNLFWKVTPKFITRMYNPTLSHGGKVVTKAEPTIKVIAQKEILSFSTPTHSNYCPI